MKMKILKMLYEERNNPPVSSKKLEERLNIDYVELESNIENLEENEYIRFTKKDTFDEFKVKITNYGIKYYKENS